MAKQQNCAGQARGLELFHRGQKEAVEGAGGGCSRGRTQAPPTISSSCCHGAIHSTHTGHTTDGLFPSLPPQPSRSNGALSFPPFPPPIPFHSTAFPPHQNRTNHWSNRTTKNHAQAHPLAPPPAAPAAAHARLCRTLGLLLPARSRPRRRGVQGHPVAGRQAPQAPHAKGHPGTSLCLH